MFTEFSEAELLHLSLEDDEHTLTCTYEFGLLVTTVIGFLLVLRGVTFLVLAFLFVGFAITLRCNTTVIGEN